MKPATLGRVGSDMTHMKNPSLGLLVKLASVAVHAEEILSPHRHEFDIDAIKTLLDDAEVKSWLAEMAKQGLLPVKRNT